MINPEENNDEETCSTISISDSSSDESVQNIETFQTSIWYFIPDTRIFPGIPVLININCVAKYWKGSAYFEPLRHFSLKEQRIRASCSQHREEYGGLELNVILSYTKVPNGKVFFNKAYIEKIYDLDPEDIPSLYTNDGCRARKHNVDIEVICQFYQKFDDEECYTEVDMTAVKKYWVRKEYLTRPNYSAVDEDSEEESKDSDVQERSFYQFNVSYEMDM